MNIIGAFFLGVLTSLTPCIYPMIPLTISILQLQAQKNVFHNFLLSFSYALGVATLYAILGYIVAQTTLIFGEWFSHPLFIVFLVAFFLYFALSMFGFYEVYIPHFMQLQHTDKPVQGSLFLAFIYGALSGTVTSPCLTPALAITLGAVAQEAHPLIGFAIMFSFALGLSLLFIVIGTSSTLIQFLPQSGSWMIEVKRFLGFLLLGTGIYILQPLLHDFVSYTLYASLLSGMALYMYFTTNNAS